VYSGLAEFQGRFADDQYVVSPVMPARNIFRWQGAKAGSREREIHVADLRSDRAVSGSTPYRQRPKGQGR
jgi:hypothetical protein